MGQAREPGQIFAAELNEQMLATLRLIRGTLNKIDIEAVELRPRPPGTTPPGGGVALDSIGTAGSFGTLGGCAGTFGTFGSASTLEATR